jgi:glycosyltransferase involved in cell wall biosynthesis
VIAELKRRGCSIPVVLRLTAPNYGDKFGGVQKADAVIASGMTIQKMKDEGHDTVYDIPNSVDIRVFRPKMTDFREENDIGELEFVLLYVARFQDFKDHETLIRALKVASRYKKGVRLLLAGSGHMERTIKSLVQKFGLEKRVLFLGEVPYEQLPGVYAAADIKVISSVYESFCFAAIEAMACELPIITTNNGWVTRLLGDNGRQAGEQHARNSVERNGNVKDVELGYGGLITKFKRAFGRRETLSSVLEECDTGVEREKTLGEDLTAKLFEGGLVVPVGDVYVLADAILWLSKKKSLMERMGKRNRKFVKEHYVWERNAQKLLDVYEGILG